MIQLQPNEWMMLAAMVGAIFHMANGYLDKRQANPNTKFEYSYLTKTAITIIVMGLAFDQIEVVEVSLGGILFALLSGMGGNRELSKRMTKR